MELLYHAHSLESKIILLDFGGQSSKVKVIVTSHQSHACEPSASGTLREDFFAANVPQMFNWEGQAHCDL